MQPNRRHLLHMTLIGFIILLVSVGGYFTGVNRINAQSQPLHHDHRHSVIAITGPCAPFLQSDKGDREELRKITAAFAQLGKEAQFIYVLYDEAVDYLGRGEADGIWIPASMHLSDNGYFSSSPLIEKEIIAVTLAADQQPAADSGTLDLGEARVGIHPEILEIVKPQLEKQMLNSDSWKILTNHVLLASLLFIGEIDVLITEESIFRESLQKVPENASPSQQYRISRIFDPFYPVILFRDQQLRDRFNAAWQQVAGAEPVASTP
jgi:hypothetical protein